MDVHFWYFKTVEDGLKCSSAFFQIQPFVWNNMSRKLTWVFDDEKDQMKLTEYFLKNGKMLQKLTIRCFPIKDMGILRRMHLLAAQSKVFCKPRSGMKDTESDFYPWN